MPTDVLPSNSLHSCLYCEDVLCLEGFSARSPGSWQGGSWVSALLSGLFCWTPSQDLALFWCFVFVSVQDLEIQWHYLPTPLELTYQGPFCFFCCLVGFWFLCGFCFCCFLVFLWFGPNLTSDCVMVSTPLSTPQSGTLQLHILNSFISTTMCDDLARATEAQDGKKKQEV